MIPVLERMPTLPADSYVVRAATTADALALLELTVMADERPITGRALIAEVGGIPTAALSLAEGRIVADPYQDCGALVAALRAQAGH